MRRWGKLFSKRRSRALLVGAAAVCALAGSQVAPAAAVAFREAAAELERLCDELNCDLELAEKKAR